MPRSEFEFTMFADRNEVYPPDAFDSQIGKCVTEGDESTTIISAEVAKDGKSVKIRAKFNRNLNRANDVAMEDA